MSYLTRLSLANRSVVALVTIALILFGAFVIPLLKQELLPSNLSNAVISIVTPYPGATPAQVEQDVTDPLEQHLQGQQGVRSVTSLSNVGLSLITVSYASDTDLNQAQQQLAIQVNKTQPDLPDNVTAQLQTTNQNDFPIIDLAVTSAQDQLTLGTALQHTVVPALQEINGVAAVTVTGIRQQIVTVTLDAQKLQNHALSVTQIQSVLQANNLTMPAGEATANGQSLAIRVGNTFNSIQQLQDLIVSNQPSTGTPNQQDTTNTTSQAGSTPIKLSDVASIQEELAPAITLTHVNGKPSLGIALTKTPAGSTVAISQALRAQLPALESKLGHLAQISIIDDQGPQIQTSVSELTLEGALGAGFAILVILVFLLSIRSTLVTAISIPLSVLLALIALWTQGYSLNLLTLTALTVAVGRVVDDSIVVLENIYRHLRVEEDKHTAVLAGVKEVAGAVTGSTLTTVAVFLPLAFIGGSTGQQTLPLAFTITVALLASLLVALTIIPVLAYWFLPSAGLKNERLASHELTSIFERAYTPLIRWVTGHRAITVALALLLLIGSFALFPLIPISFGNPSPTPHTLQFTLQLPPNTSLDQTNHAAQQVEALLASTPSIQMYQTTVGTSNASSLAATGANTAAFTVDTNNTANINTIEQSIQQRLNTLPGLGTVTFLDQTNNLVDVSIQAADEQTLHQATQQVLTALKTTPHTTAIKSDLADAVPFIDVHVDPDKAQMHGLTSLQVGQLLQTVYSGIPATHVIFNNVQQNVEVKIAASANMLQQMPALLLPGLSGNVRLGDIATIVQSNGPLQIGHTNGNRSATITLQVVGQNYNAVLSTVQTRIAQMILPGDAKVTLGMVSTLTQDTITRLLLALVLAIPTIFIVLVITFRSLLQPLILLVAIPFAAVGSIILSALTQTPIGVSWIFGFLMLIGIVVTNAIVLIDRVNYYRAQNMDARTAVIAGGQRRVRSILMTAAATIMALLPLAMSRSESAVVSSSLAIVVIGGLASSTFLTLLFVPVLYVIVEGSKDRRERKFASSPQQTEKQVVLS